LRRLPGHNTCKCAGESGACRWYVTVSCADLYTSAKEAAQVLLEPLAGGNAKPSVRRLPYMNIDKVLAVYNMSPPMLVVESEEGELLELSLKAMNGPGISCRDTVWKRLIEDYRIFDCHHALR
jgi:hypothetical protein